MNAAPEPKPHVLVVDDDRAVRESLRRSLEFNGYTVSMASDGAEALALLQFAPNLPWLGKLPGDIRIERPGFTFVFPLATCLLISIVLTLISTLFSRR